MKSWLMIQIVSPEAAGVLLIWRWTCWIPHIFWHCTSVRKQLQKSTSKEFTMVNGWYVHKYKLSLTVTAIKVENNEQIRRIALAQLWSTFNVMAISGGDVLGCDRFDQRFLTHFQKALFAHKSRSKIKITLSCECKLFQRTLTSIILSCEWRYLT